MKLTQIKLILLVCLFARDGDNVQKPSISNSSLDSISDSFTFPRFSVGIHELPAK